MARKRLSDEQVGATLRRILYERNGAPIRAVTYDRVSTEGQVGGTSLETQELDTTGVIAAEILEVTQGTVRRVIGHCDGNSRIQE